MTTRFQQLNIENIAVGPTQDSSFIPSQRIAWISSNTTNSSLLIQSPEFITETYGIPREGPFYTTDKSRAFYKMPFCHERHKHSDEIDDQQVEEFFMKLTELDQHFGSDEFKNKMFGEKNASKYEYQPIVRGLDQPDEEEEVVEEPENRPYRPPYIKVKIDLDYESGRPTCKVIDKSSGDRDNVKVNNFKDQTDHIRFMTKHRMVIHMNRLYSMKNQAGGEKRRYGIDLKLAAMECTNKTRKLERTDSQFYDAFLD